MQLTSLSEDQNDKMVCYDRAPSATEFKKAMTEDWGESYVILYFTFPIIVATYSVILFLFYWRKVFLNANSVSVRTSLFWILSLFPVQLICHMLTMFVPEMLNYCDFIDTIWLAYALHRSYNLFRGLAGGTRLFLELTDKLQARANQAPLCCLWKLCPIVTNSKKTSRIMQLCIYQFCVVTFILMSDLV